MLYHRFFLPYNPHKLQIRSFHKNAWLFYFPQAPIESDEVIYLISINLSLPTSSPKTQHCFPEPQSHLLELRQMLPFQSCPNQAIPYNLLQEVSP